MESLHADLQDLLIRRDDLLFRSQPAAMNAPGRHGPNPVARAYHGQRAQLRGRRGKRRQDRAALPVLGERRRR